MTFAGKQRRMFIRQIERQDNVERENFDLIQMHQKSENFTKQVLKT